MSAKLFKSDVLFLQRILAVSGFYGGPFDGKFTAAVDAAEQAFEKDYDATKLAMGAFDTRTESNIRTLIPKAQKAARDFMNAVKGQSLTYRIISGTRTYAEQDALFAIGRTVDKGKKKVTNAQGGESNHNFGIAWDVGIFDGGKYLTGDTPKEDKEYVKLGALITSKVSVIEWGGNWTTFVDKPHYQLKLGKSEKELRKLLEKGKPF
jgi:peptidoglycan LD-endopeptidase CwlK